MKKNIALRGEAYGVSFTSLTDDELESLLQKVADCDDLMDIDVISNLTDEGFYEYGMLCEDAFDVDLIIDKEDESGLMEKLLEKAVNAKSKLELGSNRGANHYLFFVAVERVDFTYQVEPFDEGLLEISAVEITLPNGDVKQLITPFYEGDGFDQWDGTNISNEFYIVKSNGEIILL